jgi:phosphonoacetaldehyde hydrolase
MAPVFALEAVMRRHSISVATEELRVGMGLPKRDHLRAILALHGMAERTDQLFVDLEEELLRQIETRADLISDVAVVTQWLRSEGVRIGSTTGYTAAMMAVIGPKAAAQGYAPDVILTPDDVPAGRPSPFMIYANALRLGVWPLGTIVKIGDTPSDIAEGRNAGTWTIGMALTGNSLGLTEEEVRLLPESSRAACFSAAREALSAADAHEVVDVFADLPDALVRIARRIADGRRP